MSDNELQSLKKSIAKAIGLLIGFYRRRKGWTQTELAERASVPRPNVPMFEAGNRTPHGEVLRSILQALDVHPYVEHLIQDMSFYRPWAPDAHGTGSMSPEDVLTGIPIFLRPITAEFLLPGIEKLERVWIATRNPYEVSSEKTFLRSFLLRNLRTVEFTYFTDSLEPWRSLCDILRHAEPALAAEMDKNLRCIPVPGTHLVSEFMIFNPSMTTQSIGLTIMTSRGFPLGTYPMDVTQARNVYETFANIVRFCELSKDGRRRVTNKADDYVMIFA
jgi:transcriptional regulator with XRE-family HTH domain